jgi:hypothetical protein
VFGPLADKVGRKTTIIACIALCCISMGLSGLTHGAIVFGFWRFMFGVGNGGMVPNIMALASEYVPGRNRAPGRHLWTGADRFADVDAFLLRGDANRFSVSKPDQCRWHYRDSGEARFRIPACSSGGFKCCKRGMRIPSAPYVRTRSASVNTRMSLTSSRWST